MRYFSIVVFTVLLLASCGGGRSVVVDPPVDNPPVNDPPIDNPVVKLSLTVSSSTDNELDVSVSGGAGPYIIKVSEPTGLVAEFTQSESPDGFATFTYSPVDPVYGGGGLCFVVAEDANGITDQTDTFIGVEAMPLNDDTLYAIPTKHEVKVGEPVRVVVATGATAHPFQFMLNVGLTYDDTGSYVFHSFNYGAVGGATTDADGVWFNITTDQGFLMGPDMLPGMPGADPEDSLGDRIRSDWNICPLNGSDVPQARGSLFSLELEFNEPGLNSIGFQLFNGVNRTYYSDLASGEDRFWSVLMADEMGNLHPSVVGQVDNTILVVE